MTYFLTQTSIGIRKFQAIFLSCWKLTKFILTQAQNKDAPYYLAVLHFFFHGVSALHPMCTSITNTSNYCEVYAMWEATCETTYSQHPLVITVIGPDITSSSHGQNGRHFADNVFKRTFLNEKVRFLTKISLKFVPKGSIDNNPALV